MHNQVSAANFCAVVEILAVKYSMTNGIIAGTDVNRGIAVGNAVESRASPVNSAALLNNEVSFGVCLDVAGRRHDLFVNQPCF